MVNYQNILFITIDALRVDHLSSYGYHRETSPQFDEFFQDRGIFFTQAIAQSSHTPGSFPSIMSSTYPFDYGGDGRFAKERPALAELLQQAGLNTAAIHSNPFLSQGHGYDRGFDFFDDSLFLSENRTITWFQRVLNYFKVRPYYPASEVNQKARDWLSQLIGGDKFFLWLHYMEPHGPYIPKKKSAQLFGVADLNAREARDLWRQAHQNPETISQKGKERLINLYDAEIHSLDRQLGKFLEWLVKQPFWPETLVVLGADHGEAFGEHGEYNHPRRLYDELIHVPLFLFAEDFDGGEIIAHQVRNLDIAPTILDALGLSIPQEMQGQALMDPLLQDNLTAISECLGEKKKRGNRHYAARQGGYKYLLRLDQNKNRKEEELYSIGDDPKERVNLVDEEGHHDILENLRRLLEKHRDRISTKEVQTPKLSVKEEQEVKDRLGRLGYL